MQPLDKLMSIINTMGGAIEVRDLLAFPVGDNASDTIIGGVHYNLTTLEHWNYTYYSNGTFSNGSLCFILFEPYTPRLLQNGTFLNSTSCYSPIQPLGLRSEIGLGFAVFFALSIMFTFINLRKHGKLLLPAERRFRAIGRRWQWYWMLFVAACGIISGITGVDIDRYYLPELPIALSSFFWFLMLPTTMCVVWESVRHWGSWQERQFVDPNPFMLKQDDKRTHVEFYLPLIFYFCAWMNFFMIIPRSWASIEKQRSPEQSRLIAEPAATDVRFKIAAFFLFGGWLTTVFSLQHSIHHYKPPNRGLFNHLLTISRHTPARFLLTLPLSLVMIGYEVVIAFDFSVSPLKVSTNLGMLYGIGWGVIAAILVVQETFGYLNLNEDRDLILQRRIRGAEIDREMNIQRKPHWWSRLHGNNQDLSVHDQILRNVTEIGGESVTARGVERNIEMEIMSVSKKQDNSKGARNLDAVRHAANLLFPGHTRPEKTQERFADHPDPVRGRSAITTENTEQSRTEEHRVADRSDSHISDASGARLGARPQQIRSMLDV